VIAAGLGLALVGCAEPVREPPRKTAAPAEAHGWSRTPRIESARTSAGGLVVTGSAEPGGRVVLRSGAGAAHAAVADSRGAFEVRIPAAEGHLLLRPETQMGQEAAVSPDRLLILDGGRGPVAVLRPGGPTRRLDRTPALGAVDSDGRMVMASGRAESPDRPVEVSGGGVATRVQPAPDGRWSVLLPATPGDTFTIGEAEFVWPGPVGTGPNELQAEQSSGGWRVGWSGPDGARQWTWLPAATS